MKNIFTKIIIKNKIKFMHENKLLSWFLILFIVSILFSNIFFWKLWCIYFILKYLIVCLFKYFFYF